jgi:hypothetical protein
VKHHQMILEFARLLEDLFRWFMLPKLTYSGRNLKCDNEPQPLSEVLYFSFSHVYFGLRFVDDGRIFAG